MYGIEKIVRTSQISIAIFIVQRQWIRYRIKWDLTSRQNPIEIRVVDPLTDVTGESYFPPDQKARRKIFPSDCLTWTYLSKN